MAQVRDDPSSLAERPVAGRAWLAAYPLTEPFVIARGTKTQAVCLWIELRVGEVRGRGLATPYPRFREHPEEACAAAEVALARFDGAALARVERAVARMSPGAVKNAFDLALWDLRAKLSGARVWDLLQRPAPGALETCRTVSAGAPEDLGAAAAALPTRFLKVKLKGDGRDGERIAAVRAARPDATLVADANEAFDLEGLHDFAAQTTEHDVAVIEQPLPAGEDGALDLYRGAAPLCADESVRTAGDLDQLSKAYSMVNVKLDKAGGLTDALALLEAAKARGLKIMVGCMAAPSLAVAPALLLAAEADLIDLDGPFLVARDDRPSLAREDGRLDVPQAALWG